MLAGSLSRVNLLTLIGSGIVSALLGLFAPAATDADAYNDCYPGDTSDCHLIWDDGFAGQVYWIDLTSWGGSYATAVANSGLTWHYASSLDIVQVYGSGYQVDVTLYDFGSNSDPGRTFLYMYDDSTPTISDIFAADIQLNSHSSYSWNTSGVMHEINRDVDVRTITTHEFGHIFWLAHPKDDGPTVQTCSNNPNAIMCVTWTYKVSLNWDDLAGAIYLYPW